MKIIDYEIKGNQVKFYLGPDTLMDWWGDDWDDKPYECNAETVYSEYVIATLIKTFDFDDIVMEPCTGHMNSNVSKEDMKKRKVPCVCVLPKQYKEQYTTYWEFEDIANNTNTIKFYFGDIIEDDDITIAKITTPEYLRVSGLDWMNVKEFTTTMTGISCMLQSMVHHNKYNENFLNDKTIKNWQSYLKKMFIEIYKFNYSPTKDIVDKIKNTICIEKANRQRMTHYIDICIKSNYKFDIGSIIIKA